MSGDTGRVNGRRLVAERGLVASAAAALTTHAFTALPFEPLGPTKALLKRFFSAEGWDESDEEALAVAVGPGEGWWREPLDDDLVLSFGWIDGRFTLRVEGTPKAGRESWPDPSETLAATFEGPIVPEATPNPRTLAFRTGAIHEGESRSYTSAAEADDPRVARLFRSFPELAGALVARDFVALTMRRPDQWETLLVPVLEVMTEEFAAGETGATSAVGVPDTLQAGARAPGAERPREETRLERAWRELGSLRPADPNDLDRLLAAAAAPDAAVRQVAARLLAEAQPEVAHAEWARLLGDPSRMVRRSVVDAMVDAGREELRPLLERALGDADAWVRWKALRGLGELGVSASLAVIQPLAADPDFRVRLEARAALGP